MFKRRLGSEALAVCEHGHLCPQILELNNGDFAAVGVDITADALPAMPPGPGVGPNERVVLLPRRVIVEARRDIPES